MRLIVCVLVALSLLAAPLVETSTAQTRTVSPPITATAGQIIRGVKITSTSGPCITVNNVADVWIDNVELGPCAGNGVKITGSGATGIRVTNSVIHTERTGDSGVGVWIQDASDVLVQGNQLLYNGSGVYAINASSIRVIGNYGLNPRGPFPRGQHVQFNNVQGGEITDNFGEAKTTGVLFQPDIEDTLNIYKSSDILVARNYMLGPAPGQNPGATGCGVIIGDSGGDRNIVEDNTLIKTGQCGVGVAGGKDSIVRRNKILDPNFSGGSGNVGIYVANYSSPLACSGHTVAENIVSNKLPSGAYNDIWFSSSSSCGTVNQTPANIKGDAARVLLTPEADKLPRPAIPPKPYGLVPEASPAGCDKHLADYDAAVLAADWSRALAVLKRFELCMVYGK